MRSIRMFAAATAFAVVAAGIGPAVAQDQAPPPGPPAGPMTGAQATGPEMCHAMAGHVEGRLAYIKAELKITAAQEPLWQAYAAAARDGADTMLAQCTAMMSERGKAAARLPDRLDQHEAHLAAQLDAVRTMNKTLKPLYAALSDSQKQMADQLFMGPMGAM